MNLGVSCDGIVSLCSRNLTCIMVYREGEGEEHMKFNFQKVSSAEIVKLCRVLYLELVIKQKYL